MRCARIVAEPGGGAGACGCQLCAWVQTLPLLVSGCIHLAHATPVTRVGSLIANRARFYLGCWLYDRRRYADAIVLWRRAVELDPQGLPSAWRGLGIVAFNIEKVSLVVNQVKRVCKVKMDPQGLPSAWCWLQSPRSTLKRWEIVYVDESGESARVAVQVEPTLDPLSSLDRALATSSTALSQQTCCPNPYPPLPQDPKAAAAAYDRAFALAPSDSRLLYERDQLSKRCGTTPAQRLALLESHPDLVQQRDALAAEACALYCQEGRPEAAKALLEGRRWQPWEGGEGEALAQHVRCHLALVCFLGAAVVCMFQEQCRL